VSVSSSASTLVAQVGDEIGYTVTVANRSDEDLDDVVVVDLVPAEVDVVGVSVTEDVEATQVGSSATGEDIVWVLDVAADQTIELGWRGRAVAAGDLVAENEVTLKVDQDVVSRDESASYLAAAARGPVSNPPVPKVRKRVVTHVRVPANSPAAAAAGGSVLPVTGAAIALWLSTASLLIAAGLAMLVWARGGRRSRMITALVCVSIATAACTMGNEAPDRAAPPAASASPEGEVEDRVKGKRIERNDADDDNGAADTTGTAPDTVDVADVPAETTVPATVVVPVVTYELEPADLPTETLASRPGDNNASFEWSADDRTMGTAVSSTVYTRDATVGILFSLREEGGQLVTDVTLTNLSDDNRLHVDGRLVYDVVGDAGTAHLESDPIDVVLNPGGSTTATFRYLLPTGSYSSSAAFVAD